MADNDIDNAADLLDYDEEENTTEAAAQNDAGGAENATKKQVKGSYVSIHSSGFRDFLLKPELLRAIVDCGFEHPSEGLPPHPVLSETAFSLFSLPHSSRRVHTTGDPRDGRGVPGQERHGEDGRVRHCHSPAAGAY